MPVIGGAEIRILLAHVRSGEVDIATAEMYLNELVQKALEAGYWGAHPSDPARVGEQRTGVPEAVGEAPSTQGEMAVDDSREWGQAVDDTSSARDTEGAR
jgi:hypothetical protein